MIRKWLFILFTVAVAVHLLSTAYGRTARTLEVYHQINGS